MPSFSDTWPVSTCEVAILHICERLLCDINHTRIIIILDFNPLYMDYRGYLKIIPWWSRNSRRPGRSARRREEVDVRSDTRSQADCNAVEQTPCTLPASASPSPSRPPPSTPRRRTASVPPPPPSPAARRPSPSSRPRMTSSTTAT